MTQSARDARHVESLERQITLLKERHDKVQFERNNLETVKYSQERTKETIKAQLEAARLVNEKLNSELPADQKILLDDMGKLQDNAKSDAKKNRSYLTLLSVFIRER